MYEHQPPFDSGRLPVGRIHMLSYEQYGRRDGEPALFLHGGPGGNTSIDNTIYFDPAVYRLVMFDQRGAGKSTPSAETRENTSQHLVGDIETLRSHLGISKWHLVFGGSWGSALSLMYAQAHPTKVRSLILRGVFTGRKRELDFHRGPAGAAMLFPEAYAAFLKPLPVSDHHDPIAGYARLLQHPDVREKQAAIRAYKAWDIMTSCIKVSDENWAKLDDVKWCLEHAVLECHYFTNGIFIRDGELLEKGNMDKIRHIPCTIIQGQYDICTAPQTAFELHLQWTGSVLHMLPGAGHSVNDPGMCEQLTRSCDQHAQLPL